LYSICPRLVVGCTSPSFEKFSWIKESAGLQGGHQDVFSDYFDYLYEFTLRVLPTGDRESPCLAWR